MKDSKDRNSRKQLSKDLNELLTKHSKGATHIIVAPETVEIAINAGVKLEKTPPMSDEEYVGKLFGARKKVALSVIDRLPPSPSVAIPPIGSLYEEIKECILFGLNGAAITLSAILVEFSLKHAIINRTKGVDLYNKEEWDRLENKELGPVIKEAQQLKIIDENGATELNRFKNEVRNMYLHYNIKKITTGAIMQRATRLNVETGKAVVEYNLKAEEHPILWQMSKQKIDEQSVMPIFLFADLLVKQLLE